MVLDLIAMNPYYPC